MVQNARFTTRSAWVYRRTRKMVVRHSNSCGYIGRPLVLRYTVVLMLRAYSKGPEYGWPLTSLDHSCSDHRCSDASDSLRRQWSLWRGYTTKIIHGQVLRRSSFNWQLQSMNLVPLRSSGGTLPPAPTHILPSCRLDADKSAWVTWKV